MMNTYFSRTEKILMTRLMITSGLMAENLKEYEKGSTDKAFMKSLRMAHTWLGKALDRRFEFLEKDAYTDFIRHINHMDILFVPNDKAKKEREKIAAMQDSVYLSADTFEALYSAIIPYTCADCPRKKDFKQCMLRETFMQAGILPVDSYAKEACQYDYLAAGIDLMEWARQNLQKGIEIDDWAKQLPEKSRAKWNEAKEKGSRQEEAGSRK